MALLIVLAIIGGFVGLIALYVLGTYLIAAIMGHTQLVKEKIKAVIEGYKARRNAKKQVKVEETVAEEITEEPTVEPEVEIEQ